MTAHKYLQQLRHIKWQINSCVIELERLEEEMDHNYQLSGIDYSKDRVMTSAGNNQFKPSEHRVDLIMKREKLKQDLIMKRDRIIDQIHAVNKEPHSELLERYYVNSESLLDIATAIHISYDRTRHIHSEALILFGEMYGFEKSTHDSTDN